MTICNMAVEAGARGALVAPDDRVYAYIKGRPRAPLGAMWEQAVAAWRLLEQRPGCRLRQRGRSPCGRDRADGHLGHQPRPGGADRHAGARSGGRARSRPPPRHGASAGLHGPDGRHAAGRDRHRSRLYRILHQRPASRICAMPHWSSAAAMSRRACERWWCRGLAAVQPPGRGRRARPRLPRRRFRVAAVRLLDVPGDERRRARRRRTLRLQHQPQFRGPARRWRPHPSDEPGHGCGRRHRRTPDRRAPRRRGTLTMQPFSIVSGVGRPDAGV